MFCKASVLKCPGLKGGKKAAYTVLLAESYLFHIVEIFKSTLSPRPQQNKNREKENVACWLKLEQSALKH